MRTAQALAVLACLTPLAQENEPSFEEELAALVARTNALTSFRLVYDVESTSDGETSKGTMEFVYRAPNLGHIRASTDRGATDFWVVDGNVYRQGDDGWKSAHVPDPPMAAIMREHFPDGEKPLEPGVSFLMSVNRSVPEEPRTNLTFSWSWNGRDHVLSWLDDLRSRPGVARQDESFVWEDEGIRCHISRVTGLLEEIGTDSLPISFRLHLRSAETDVELPPELVTVPDEALEAPLDAEFARSFTYPPSLLRRLAFLRVERLVSSGARDFDARARKDWRSAMEALHREVILQQHSEIDKLRATVTKRGESVREELAADPSPERRAKIEKSIAENRSGLEEGLAAMHERYAKALPLVGSEELEPCAELYDIEHEVMAALWEELVSGPVLTHHDEEMARALER